MGMGMGIKTGDRAFESKSKWEAKSKTGTSLSIRMTMGIKSRAPWES